VKTNSAFVRRYLDALQLVNIMMSGLSCIQLNLPRMHCQEDSIGINYDVGSIMYTVTSSQDALPRMAYYKAVSWKPGSCVVDRLLIMGGGMREGENYIVLLSAGT
jgi:hypothetical protein